MASKYTKLKFSGELTRSAFPEAISLGMQGLLNDVGATALLNMQNITRKHDASGELTDSLMWANAGNSSNMGSRADESEKIPRPTDPYKVLIGSMAEHAIYRETTSGIHTRPDRPELFVERMKEWYRTRFGKNPDDPENQNSFWKLVGIVSKTVTDGVPFVEPTRDMALDFTKKRFKQLMADAIRKRE